MVNKQLFLGIPAAAMHESTQQRLHPLICGVNIAPANVTILAGRPQSGQLYGRSHGSAESDCNASGGVVVTSYFSGCNFLRIFCTVGRLIYASYGTANGSDGGSGGTMRWTDYG